LTTSVFSASPSHTSLHSFPTRRSSDLYSMVPFGPTRQPVEVTGDVLPLGRSTCQPYDTAWPPDPGYSGPGWAVPPGPGRCADPGDRKSTRLNSSHLGISYAVFCLKKKR